MKNWKSWVAGLALCSLGFVPSQASAAPVGLELLLLVDVSGSIDSSEYALQKQGYVNAFNNATIQANIASISGGVAVAYAEWSSSGQQSLEVGWTLLTNAASSSAFANAIQSSTRNFSGLTAPGTAINWGVGLMNNNQYTGNRLVIDVSGDGSQNDGASTFTAATNAFSGGITVNGLAILGSESGLATWYQNNIVTPGHGFLEVANNFTDFQDALTRKIGKEVVGVPEPASLLLLGSGLVGLGFWRRREANNA